jgi:hypothetical protein
MQKVISPTMYGVKDWVEQLSDLWRDQRLSLKLVCEHCGEPVPCGREGRGYIFKRPTESMVRMLPLMQVSSVTRFPRTLSSCTTTCLQQSQCCPSQGCSA